MKERRNSSRNYHSQSTIKNADAVVDVFLDLGVTRRRIDRALFRRDIERLLSSYWGFPLKELSVAALLNDVYSVMREHNLHLPSNLALLLKTIIMIEGIGTTLDPDFQMTRQLKPCGSYSNVVVIASPVPCN